MLAHGLVIGAAVMAGSILARRILRHVTPRHHDLLIDGVLAVAAAGMLLGALR